MYFFVQNQCFSKPNQVVLSPFIVSYVKPLMPQNLAGWLHKKANVAEISIDFLTESQLG